MTGTAESAVGSAVGADAGLAAGADAGPAVETAVAVDGVGPAVQADETDAEGM